MHAPPILNNRGPKAVASSANRRTTPGFFSIPLLLARPATTDIILKAFF